MVHVFIVYGMQMYAFFRKSPLFLPKIFSATAKPGHTERPSPCTHASSSMPQHCNSTGMRIEAPGTMPGWAKTPNFTLQDAARAIVPFRTPAPVWSARQALTAPLVVCQLFDDDLLTFYNKDAFWE